MARIGERNGCETLVIASRSDPYASNRLAMAVGVRATHLGQQVERWTWRLLAHALGGTTPDPTEPLLQRSRDVPSTIRRLDVVPDLLVVNSMRGFDLRRIAAIGEDLSLPIAWYLRESSSLALVPRWGPRFARVLANSEPLAVSAQELGVDCVYLPSYIDTEHLRPPIDRTVVLLVNPVSSHGVDVALGLAELMPHVRFALQESWPLEAGHRALLERSVARLPNLELRSRRPRSELYVDAALLLAPHDAHAVGLARPRTALEAQAVGVPLVASDVPGLRAVAASPQLLVRPGSSLNAWRSAIEATLEQIEHLGAVAERFVASELLDEEELWERFVSIAP